MSSLFIGTPHLRPYETGYVASALFMHKPESMVWSPQPDAPPDVARNILVERCLVDETKPEYLLFCDDDATWAAGAALRLMERELPMVTGIIYKAGLPPVPTLGKYHGINKDGHHTYDFRWTMDRILAQAKRLDWDLHVENEQCTPKHESDVQEIDGCGMHFCLIRRDVLEKVEPPWFVCTSPGAGEDFYFCRKVKQFGFPIYADFSVHTGHIMGPRVNVGLREFLAFFKYTDELKRSTQIWDVGIEIRRS